MTLSVLEDYSPIAQAFSSATFRICGASRCPSASAERLVPFTASTQTHTDRRTVTDPIN